MSFKKKTAAVLLAALIVMLCAPVAMARDFEGNLYPGEVDFNPEPNPPLSENDQIFNNYGFIVLGSNNVRPSYSTNWATDSTDGSVWTKAEEDLGLTPVQNLTLCNIYNIKNEWEKYTQNPSTGTYEATKLTSAAPYTVKYWINFRNKYNSYKTVEVYSQNATTGKWEKLESTYAGGIVTTQITGNALLAYVTTDKTYSTVILPKGTVYYSTANYWWKQDGKLPEPIGAPMRLLQATQVQMGGLYSNGYADFYMGGMSFVTPEEQPSTLPDEFAASGLKAVLSGANGIKLTWKKVANADGYEVYRTSDKRNFELVYDGAATSYTDKGLTSYKKYYYHVRPYKEEGDVTIYGEYSAYAGIKAGIPNATNVKATALSASAVKISWKKNTGVNGYEIYGGQDRNSLKLVGTQKSGSATSYTVKKGLTANTTYYYKVRTYKMVGKTKVYGVFSSVIPVTTKA